MEFAAVVTLILSIYAAVLATYVALHGVMRDRKTVVVKCGLGYRPGPTDGDDVVQVITIEATNIGPRPIEVSGAGFVRAEDGEHIERAAYAVEPSLPPITLMDGASARFSYRMSDARVSEHTFEVWKVYVRTSPDGVWFGEPDEWLQPLRMTHRWWG
jgi:hypothetical protein